MIDGSACALNSIAFKTPGRRIARAALLFLPLLSQGSRLDSVTLELQTGIALYAFERFAHLIRTVDIGSF